MKQEYENNINFFRRVVEVLMPKLPYHNFMHADGVYESAKMYAELNGLSEHESYLLETAGLGHDLGYTLGRGDNEENTSRELFDLLPTIGYDLRDAIDIGKMVLPTKLPQRPTNLLEAILCDSDLDSLGREDFFLWGDRLRKEWKKEDNIEWYGKQLEFLEEHEYHTKVARDLRKEGKEKNMRKLKEKMDSMTIKPFEEEKELELIYETRAWPVGYR
ncbi:hypothetical protein COU57_02285 [Candidatus Pacearchaeota archaeon CG10_big_fil_rev_8_21_14_0_10_32_14]|nr:MAG: hypothetical protein COU57_02285 [Candidatus Pacearchaeota archaeon CG10_big_fil_rev_8_21_14_0_10_32_14]